MAETPSGFFSRPPKRPAAPPPFRPTTRPGFAAEIKSTGTLITVNILTIVIGIITGTPWTLLMLPYWVQSAVIGYYGLRRILELQRFSTEGVTIEEAGFAGELPATEVGKRAAARSFSMMYVGFLCGFLFIIWALPGPTLGDTTLPVRIGLGIAALSFVWNHRLSFKRNAAADRSGTPNIGALMFVPLARIVPMTLIVCLSAAFDFQGVFPVLIFGVVKTGADMFMHLAEHEVLQTGSLSVLRKRSLF